MTSGRHWLWRAVPATPAERAAALWSFAYFFMLLAGYYVLRPVRDQMGIAGGVKASPAPRQRAQGSRPRRRSGCRLEQPDQDVHEDGQQDGDRE